MSDVYFPAGIITVNDPLTVLGVSECVFVKFLTFKFIPVCVSVCVFMVIYFLFICLQYKS